jgi:hypothetical protein
MEEPQPQPGAIENSTIKESDLWSRMKEKASDAYSIGKRFLGDAVSIGAKVGSFLTRPEVRKSINHYLTGDQSNRLDKFTTDLKEKNGKLQQFQNDVRIGEKAYHSIEKPRKARITGDYGNTMMGALSKNQIRKLARF